MLVPLKSLSAVSYSGFILHHLRDKARYWSKIVIFSYINAFDAPVRGSPSEYCRPVWCGKTRMVGLPDGEKTLSMSNRLNRILACDRQTDGQTFCHGRVRAMHTHRAVKMIRTAWALNPDSSVTVATQRLPRRYQ